MLSPLDENAQKTVKKVLQYFHYLKFLHYEVISSLVTFKNAYKVNSLESLNFALAQRLNLIFNKILVM